MEEQPNSTKTTGSLYLRLEPILMLISLGLLFFPTLSLLFTRWTKWDESMSHGLVILLTFGYLLFKQAPLTAHQQTAHGKIASLLVLAGASLLWLLFHLINLYIFEQFLLILLICLSINAAYGWQTLYQLRMPIGLLLFAIPLWDPLVNPLVKLSSFAVGNLVSWVNIPAVIDGNSIFIPYGHILIADGCSGIRYFVIALALAYIISLLNNYNLLKTTISLVIAALIGLIANWLRIFILVIIGYKTHMQSPMMANHEYFGWALFAFICFPFIYFAPVIKHVQSKSPVAPRSSKYLILPFIALALGPVLNLVIKQEIPQQQPKALLASTLPAQLPMNTPLPPASLRETGVIGEVAVQIDHYQRASAKEKLVPYIPHLYDPEYWTLETKYPISINSNNASIGIFRNKTTGKVVAQLQWFSIAGYTTSRVSTAKLLQIPAILLGKNQFTIFTLQAACKDEGCSPEIRRLEHTAKTINLNKEEN